MNNKIKNLAIVFLFITFVYFLWYFFDKDHRFFSQWETINVNNQIQDIKGLDDIDVSFDYSYTLRKYYSNKNNIVYSIFYKKEPNKPIYNKIFYIFDTNINLLAKLNIEIEKGTLGSIYVDNDTIHIDNSEIEILYNLDNKFKTKQSETKWIKEKVNNYKNDISLKKEDKKNSYSFYPNPNNKSPKFRNNELINYLKSRTNYSNWRELGFSSSIKEHYMGDITSIRAKSGEILSSKSKIVKKFFKYKNKGVIFNNKILTLNHEYQFRYINLNSCFYLLTNKSVHSIYRKDDEKFFNESKIFKKFNICDFK